MFVCVLWLILMSMLGWFSVRVYVCVFLMYYWDLVFELIRNLNTFCWLHFSNFCVSLSSYVFLLFASWLCCRCDLSLCRCYDGRIAVVFRFVWTISIDALILLIVRRCLAGRCGVSRCRRSDRPSRCRSLAKREKKTVLVNVEIEECGELWRRVYILFF